MPDTNTLASTAAALRSETFPPNVGPLVLFAEAAAESITLLSSRITALENELATAKQLIGALNAAPAQSTSPAPAVK